MPKTLQIKSFILITSILAGALIVMTILSWLFLSNAQNCLARDFREKAPPAICYRETNDYEITIDVAAAVFRACFMALVVVAMVNFSLRRIYRGITPYRHKCVILLLLVASLLVFIFMQIVFSIYHDTPYSNNNHVLNTWFNWAYSAGRPLLLALATALLTYIVSFSPKKAEQS